MIRIAYIDAKVNANPPESYALNPRRYGGGATVARYCKELLNNDDYTFTIFASKDCFDELGALDNKNACVVVNDSLLSDIRGGRPVVDCIPEIAAYDIVLHHHDCLGIQMTGLPGVLVHWDLMSSGTANANAAYSLLYNKRVTAHRGRTIHVILGKYVSPTFEPSPKEDFIFSCSRNDVHMNTIEVAQFCLKHSIKGIFAGPILDNYPLKDYIDNVTTFYLGALSEENKLAYTRRARLYPFLHRWNTAFNQSAIEALACGTPIVANPVGFFNDLVEPGVNGFIHRGENLLGAWEAAPRIDQRACWESARKYSHEAMVESFRLAFEQIYKETRGL